MVPRPLFAAGTAVIEGVAGGDGRTPVPLVAALLVALWVLGLGVFREGAIFPSERPPLAIALLVTGLVWWALERRRRDSSPVDQVGLTAAGRVSVGGLAVFAAWSLLSSSWSILPGRSAWMGLVYAAGVVAFYAGVRLRTVSWAGLPLIAPVLAVIGALVSWISLVGYGLGWTSYLGVIGGVSHAQGPFGYANALASLIVLTLPATAWVAVVAPPGWAARALAGGSAVLQGWAFTLTHSRGAVLALAAAVGAVAVAAVWRRAARLERPSWRRALRGAIAALLTALLLTVGLIAWQRMGGFVLAPIAGPVQIAADGPDGASRSEVGTMTSDAYRIRTWVAAMDAFRERPVAGWGVDTFYEAYAPYKPGAETRYAHNLFVQAGVETGLIGVLALLAAVGAAVAAWVLTALQRPLRDPDVWVGSSVAAFLAHNLVDLSWYVPALFYLAWVCVGCVVATRTPRLLTYRQVLRSR